MKLPLMKVGLQSMLSSLHNFIVDSTPKTTLSISGPFQALGHSEITVKGQLEFIVSLHVVEKRQQLPAGRPPGPVIFEAQTA